MLEGLNCSVAYLPAYSPCLAPIEIAFSYIKHVLKRNCKTTVVNLATKDGVSEITKLLSTLNSTTI